MASGTVVSRITGMVRDVVLIAAIGTGVFSDTYSIGNTIPNIIYILIVGGALNAVFIPQLVRRMKDDDDDGAAYADRLLTITGLILLAVSALAVLLAPWIVRLYGSGNWSANDLSTATAFARYCLPQIFFYGVYTMLAQVLNTRGRFGAPMFAPIVNNAVVVIAALMFIGIVGSNPSTSTITSGQIALLGIGTTLGVVAQAAVLVPVLRRAGYLYRPRFDFRGQGLGKAGQLAKWTIGFVLINQLSYLVIANLTTSNNVNAAREGLAAAGFTSYQKAHLLFILPHSIVTVSIVTALLPRMSRAAHNLDFRRVSRDVSSGMRLTAAMLMPASGAFIVFGATIAALLYARGATSPADATNIGHVLSWFAVGLPAFSLYYVLLRGFFSLEDTKTPFWINLLLNVFNLAIAVPLFFAVGESSRIEALALGYSLAYWLSLVISWRVLGKRIGGLETRHTVRSLVRIGIATLIAMGIAYGVVVALSHWRSTGALAWWSALIVGGSVFVVAYFTAAWAMRITEIDDVFAMVGRRVPGLPSRATQRPGGSGHEPQHRSPPESPPD
jgi:putative peptidoglycan lipid II flippase